MDSLHSNQMNSHEACDYEPKNLEDNAEGHSTENESDLQEERYRNRNNTEFAIQLEPDAIVHIEDNSNADTAIPHCETGPVMNAVQMRLLATKERRNLNSDLPLPNGKEAHFFISYSSEDRSTVIPIVAELEETHKIFCIIDERDFKPGMHIYDNISRGMERSMNVLLFLSKSFLQSSYCNYESHLAKSMRVEGSIIIPLKLEECDMPSSLETLTYIDVNTKNLAERIVEAISKADTDFLPTDFDNDRKLKNGYSVTLPNVIENTCTLRQNRHRTVLDEKTKNLLKIGKFQVAQDTIQVAMDIVNSHKSSWSWSGIIALVTVGLFFSWTFIGLPVYSVKVALNINLFAVTVTGIFIVPVGMLCFVFERREKEMSRLIVNLFTRVTMRTYKEGVLFKVSIDTKMSRNITLEIMRYDIKPCQSFLAGKIKEIKERSGGVCEYSVNDFEDRADFLIRKILFQYIYGSVPDAPENRHNVKGGKSCFCQMLEPSIEQQVQSLPSHLCLT